MFFPVVFDIQHTQRTQHEIVHTTS